MTRKQRDRLDALIRRLGHLEERLELWARGDPSRTQAERGALIWAISVILGADEEGVLGQLEQEGLTKFNEERRAQ